jgi:hypothetical protein
MPIRFFCPECDARVSAPEDAAGTYVDCRKCGTEVRVPRARGRDRDLEDDEEVRPRSRRPRRDDDRDSRPGSGRGKKKSKLPLILGLVGAGVAAMLLIGGAIAIYVYAWSDPAGTKKIAGETWYKPDETSSMFTAYFPGGKPDYDKVGFKPPAILAKHAGDPEELAWSMQSWVRKHGRREYSVFLFKMPAKGQDADFMARMTAVTRDNQRLGAGVKILSDEPVTVTGNQGRRIVTRGGGESRATLTFPLGTRHILVMYVTGSDDFDHTDPKVAAFFDNLVIN